MANSEVNIRVLDSGLIGALQKILVHSQVITPDLETPYSRFPNISAVNGGGLGISAIVTERQQQLDAVLHEISGLESIMDSVKNLHRRLIDKKEKIIRSMNLHKGLVSALWRFPTEVLAQIFHYCLPDSHHYVPEFDHWQPYSSSDPKRDAPMQLATICQRWRNVVVDIPSLWRGLHLGEHGNLERVAFCYTSWLKRSQGVPLSLAVLCYKNNETKLRSIIQPYISQISSLYVEFFPGANPELMLKDIPALRELTVRSHNDIPAMSQSALRLPSTLRSFKLVGLDLTLKRISSLSPIFAQLTNIEIAVHHQNAMLRLLQLSPNLSSLTFNLGPGLLTRALQPFRHAKLESLRITSVYSGTLSDLFNALSLPNLRALAVARGVRGRLPHAELKALLARSNCPLESLTFDTGVTTDEQRAEYIALMPSLEVAVDRTYDDYINTMVATMVDLM